MLKDVVDLHICSVLLWINQKQGIQKFISENKKIQRTRLGVTRGTTNVWCWWHIAWIFTLHKNCCHEQGYTPVKVMELRIREFLVWDFLVSAATFTAATSETEMRICWPQNFSFGRNECFLLRIVCTQTHCSILILTEYNWLQYGKGYINSPSPIDSQSKKCLSCSEATSVWLWEFSRSWVSKKSHANKAAFTSPSVCNAGGKACNSARYATARSSQETSISWPVMKCVVFGNNFCFILGTVH